MGWVTDMAHYAKIKSGVVVNVIVAEPEFMLTFVDSSPGTWLKTSYNVKGGVYFDPVTGLPAEDQSLINEDEGRKRKNYASVGFTYSHTLDAFIPPKPFASWTLNEDTCLWEAPVPYPDDGKNYYWNEDTINWIEITE